MKKALLPAVAACCVAVLAVVYFVRLNGERSDQADSGQLSTKASSRPEPVNKGSRTAATILSPAAKPAGANGSAAVLKIKPTISSSVLRRAAPNEPSYLAQIKQITEKFPFARATAVQIEAVQKAFCDAYVARVNLEVARAQVTQVSASETLIEIPNYASEGLAIQGKLAEQIRGILDPSEADGFLDFARRGMAVANYSWGEFPQKILVTADSAQGLFKVVHAFTISALPSSAPTPATTTSLLPPGRLFQFDGFRSYFPVL